MDMGTECWTRDSEMKNIEIRKKNEAISKKSEKK